VANNIDVVQAQESLATANESYISSLNSLAVTGAGAGRGGNGHPALSGRSEVVADSVRTDEKPATEREEARDRGEEWAEEEQPSRRQRARSYFQQHPHAKWVLLLFVLVILAVGLWTWHYYSVRESTDDAQIDGYIYPVSARISGTAIKVNFDNNMYVEKGAVLAELDPTDYEVALQRAQADLADAGASAQAARTKVPITHTGTSSQLSMALAAAQKEEQAA
jgi:membrane fusion protein (multidrug efflux system)